MFARASGKSTFQPNCMIWSYLSRGNVAPFPDEDEYEHAYLDEEPERTEAGKGREGSEPAAQKQRGRRWPSTATIWAYSAMIESGELHAAVFDIKAARKLALRFRHVEGRPVHLGEARDEVENEGERLIDHEPHVALRLDDIGQP